VFTHEAEDAGGGVGGSVSALTEEFFEVEVVDAELLAADVVVEEVVEFAAEVFGGQLVLDQFAYDEFVHDEVDEGDIFYPDEAFGDLVGDVAALIADDLGHGEKRGFEGGGAGGDAGGFGVEEEPVGLVADGGDVGVGGEYIFVEGSVLAGGLGDDELVVGEEAACFEHDGEFFEDLLFATAGKEGDDGFGRVIWGVGGKACDADGAGRRKVEAVGGIVR